MNGLTLPQVQMLSQLMVGVNQVTDLTASGRALLAQVPQVDPETVQIVYTKFGSGTHQPTSAFFFRPSGWKEDTARGKFGFLVPRYMPQLVHGLSMRLMGGLPGSIFNEPDDIGVLWPVPAGETMPISAAVFSGIVETAGKYVRTRSHQDPTSGPLAELLGRDLAAASLHGVLNSPIEVLNLKRFLKDHDSTMYRFTQAGIMTIGDIVRLSESDLCKLLASKKRNFSIS